MTESTDSPFIPSWKKQQMLQQSGGNQMPQQFAQQQQQQQQQMPQQSQPNFVNDFGRSQVWSPNVNNNKPMQSNSNPMSRRMDGASERSRSWRGGNTGTPNSFFRAENSPSQPRYQQQQQQHQQQQPQQHQQQQQHREGDEGKGTKAITVEHRMVKPGEFSTWIRVLSADLGPAQLSPVLTLCEESNSTGCIYVYLREKFINRQLVQQLKSQDYKFHHYVEETQSFVYAKRPADEDQEGDEILNATSKEMVGALVISPDEKKVLLSWEGGKWNFLRAFAITRESLLDALKRELRSDFNIEIDKDFQPHVVGGWNKPSGKFDCVNESLSCFVVKAMSQDVPQKEDSTTQWFPIQELCDLLNKVDKHFKENNLEVKLDSSVELPHGHVFSHLALRWIKVFVTGNSWPVSHFADRNVFCLV